MPKQETDLMKKELCIIIKPMIKKIERDNEILNIEPVCGSAFGDSTLVWSEQGGVLVDCGFDYCADKTADNIRTVLKNKPLHYILLTYSHYDHASGCAALRKEFPDAKIVAHPYVREVFAKKGALNVMRTLNNAMAQKEGVRKEGDELNAFHLDIAAQNGDLLQWGENTIQVLWTPGHTRCSVSFYFCEHKLVAAAETVGVMPGGREVIPAFIVGFWDTLDAIETIKNLKPKRLALPHFGMVEAQKVPEFFESAKKAAQEAKNMVEELFQKGKDTKAIAEAYQKRFYTEDCARIQPEVAFLLNTEAMVPRLLSELGYKVR